jgi:hypothetical protein
MENVFSEANESIFFKQRSLEAIKEIKEAMQSWQVIPESILNSAMHIELSKSNLPEVQRLKKISFGKIISISL